MSNIFAKYGISAEKERKMWTAHRREQLLCWASLPFAKKIQMLEDMEEVARAFHGGKLPPSPDEHREQSSETLPPARKSLRLGEKS
jgi:hypothetical protein